MRRRRHMSPVPALMPRQPRRHPRYRNIYMRNTKPRSKIDRADYRHVENALECFDRCSCLGAEYAVGAQLGNSGEIVAYAIKLLLNDPHVLAARALLQQMTRPRNRYTLNLFRFANINVGAIETPQNIHIGITAPAHFFRPPLAHPVGAGDAPPIAVLRKQRLAYAGPSDISIENIIDEIRNIFKNIASVYIFLVKLCG